MKNGKDYLNLAVSIAHLTHEDVERAKRLGINGRTLLGMARSSEREKWKLPVSLFLKYCEATRTGRISVKAFLKREGLTKRDVAEMKHKIRRHG